MGLDMYVSRVKASLVNASDETDCPIMDRAMKAMGFKTKSEDELSKMSDDAVTIYWDKWQKARNKIENKGLVDNDFYYWRKFNALHGWMENLYREKGGTSVFNCTNVRLTTEDLDRLTNDTKANKLTAVEGFFFGDQEIYLEDLESIHDFVTKGKEALDEGYVLFYDSWW